MYIYISEVLGLEERWLCYHASNYYLYKEKEDDVETILRMELKTTKVGESPSYEEYRFTNGLKRKPNEYGVLVDEEDEIKAIVRLENE